jgi:prepilin-type N-terminal cleavage/methylation domain-containing protein
MKKGFTIVELLVVIVVIGILAAITVVAYSGITKRAKDAVLVSDLDGASKNISLNAISNGVVPTSFPPEVKASPGDVLSLSSTSDPNSYCVNGYYTSGGQNTYMYFDSATGQSQAGWCSGSTVYKSEIGSNPNLVYDDSFSNISVTGWRLVLSTPGGTTLTTRAGTSSDPIPNKPVLVLTNSTSKSETWSVLVGTIPYADYHNGSTYNTSYYVRQVGGFTGAINSVAIKDAAGINATFLEVVSPLITSSWQRVTSTKTAVKDGTSANVFYVYLNNSQFLNTGWSLEFQNPQVVLQ